MMQTDQLAGGPTITRSHGIVVGGFNPGGGHSGRDPILDGMVADSADRLRTLFDADVEIRFNSDRISGGAFLREGHTIGVNHVTVRLSETVEFAKRHGLDPDEQIAGLKADPHGPDEQILLRINVDARRLKDPSIANCNGGNAYLYEAVPDIDTAIARLDEVCAR